MKQDQLNFCASGSLLSIQDYATTVKINACSSERGNKILKKFFCKRIIRLIKIFKTLVVTFILVEILKF